MSSSPLSSSSAAQIAVHQLAKSFPNGTHEVQAVRGVSFAVAPGEVYGLLGPNGAGKTTTLRMILGLLAPDSGFAEVGGFRTTEAPHEVKARLGFVSAGAGLYPWHTVRELLLYFAHLYGLTDQQARVNLEELASVLRLEDFLDRRGGTLSTGQRQRVVLALGLVHDPPVLLLDEPTRGLDVVLSQVVFDYVGLLRRRGKAVIVCTHRLDQAQRLCDRFGLLHHGQLVLEGTLDELRERTGCESLVDMFLQIVQPRSSISAVDEVAGGTIAEGAP